MSTFYTSRSSSASVFRVENFLVSLNNRLIQVLLAKVNNPSPDNDSFISEFCNDLFCSISFQNNLKMHLFANNSTLS